MAGPQEGEGLCVEDVGPPEASRGWQFSVDWKPYEVPHADIQEHEGAELTLGPTPERRHEKVGCSHVWKLLPSGSETGPHLPIPGSAPGPPEPLNPAAALCPALAWTPSGHKWGWFHYPCACCPALGPSPAPQDRGCIVRGWMPSQSCNPSLNEASTKEPQITCAVASGYGGGWGVSLAKLD